MNVVFKNYINLNEAESLKVLRLRNVDFVRKNMYNTSIISEKNHLKWIKDLRNRIDCIYWAVYVDDELSGCISLSDIDETTRFAEWGFNITENNFGFGAIIEFLGLEHFICDMGLNKILARVYEENKKVYNMHKNKFFFEPNETYSCIYDNKSYKALVLSKEVWLENRKKIKLLINKFCNTIHTHWEE